MSHKIVRGTGWKADTREFVEQTDKLGPALAEQKFGAVTLPKSHTALMKHCIIRDQLTTSACVGFALTGAIYCRLRYLGIPCEVFSPAVAYALARMMERTVGTPKTTPIHDDGSYPFLAYNALRKFGVAPERAMPFPSDERHLTELIEREPDFIAVQQASQFRIAHFTRIPETGRAKACMRAIASGHPVPLGMMVGNEFMRYQPGNDPVGVEYANVAGHMTFLCGYEDNGETFIGCNSWSREWGDEGFYRISRAKLEHESTTDLSEFTITEAAA